MNPAAAALDIWATALAFLREAEGVQAVVRPRMATHGAYYAMFHGARAVLVNIEGLLAPTKHKAVVSRFGYQAKQAGNAALMAAAGDLKGVEDQRIRYDYKTDEQPDPASAAAAIIAARRFLETCARVHGFPPP